MGGERGEQRRQADIDAMKLGVDLAKCIGDLIDLLALDAVLVGPRPAIVGVGVEDTSQISVVIMRSFESCGRAAGVPVSVILARASSGS